MNFLDYLLTYGGMNKFVNKQKFSNDESIRKLQKKNYET